MRHEGFSSAVRWAAFSATAAAFSARRRRARALAYSDADLPDLLDRNAAAPHGVEFKPSDLRARSFAFLRAA
jgi:hypothetical protein